MLLLLATAWAMPTPPDLRLSPEGWLVEDLAVELGPTRFELRRGYAFPLEWEGRTVGFAWAGEGSERVDAPPELDLVGALLRELGRGLPEAAAWTEGIDLLWGFGAEVVAWLPPSRGREVPGWTPLRAELATEGDEGSLVVVDDSAVRAALRAARAGLAARSQALGLHGYPLAMSVAGAADPGRAWLEAHLDLPVSRLAGNDATGPEPWVGLAAADPYLAPDAVLAFAFGRRAAWTTGDV